MAVRIPGQTYKPGEGSTPEKTGFTKDGREVDDQRSLSSRGAGSGKGAGIEKQSQTTTPQQQQENPPKQNLSGMFGLDKIMDSFYSYKPDKDDEYGSMIKNTFSSNMIQSAFDTQNAKDLAYTQAEISSGQMKDAADLQLRNTLDIMQEEYDKGSGLMGMQYELQNKASDNQHSRDLGLLAAQGTQARETAKQQQESAERIASGQYKSSEAIADKQKEASMYGANRAAEASMYGAKQSAEASKFGASTAAGASMYGAKQSADASKYGSDKSAQASMYGADKSAQASMYGADKQLEATKDTNRTSTENIRVTGSEQRTTMQEEQRLKAKDRGQQHQIARSTARAF